MNGKSILYACRKSIFYAIRPLLQLLFLACFSNRRCLIPSPRWDGNKCKRFSAFTLMELLVVITIVGVLVAMLLPAMKMVRGSAETTRCRSIMQQFGIAMHCYANDNDGWIPPNSYNGSMGHSGVKIYSGIWLDYYSGYIANQDKFLAGLTCPTHLRRMINVAGIPRDAWAGRSYAPIYPNYRWEPTCISTVPRISQSIYIAEKNGDWSGSGDVRTIYSRPPISQDTGLDVITPGITPGSAGSVGDTIRISHRGRFGILCLDGHVEFALPQETVGIPCDPSGNVKPNRWTASY